MLLLISQKDHFYKTSCVLAYFSNNYKTCIYDTLEIKILEVLELLIQARENQFICRPRNAVLLTSSGFQGVYTYKEINDEIRK